MEYFDFFFKIFQKEIIKNNLNSKKVIAYNAELNRVDGIFEIPYNRCAYIYKYATCTLSFIKNCMTTFLDEYSDLENLLLMWKSCSNLKMCSLSCGPGLDYLAFTAALSEFVKLDLQPIVKEVNIVSRSAQWKSTLNIIIESIGSLKDFPISTLCEKFNVIQDRFQIFSGKQKVAVQNAQIIFMVKTLSLESSETFEDKQTYFKELVNTMGTDSIIFCIDTKSSVTLMAQVLCQVPGEYIYGPFLNNIFRLPETFPEIYKETFGCLPIISARGAFFVWKKLPVNSSFANAYPSVLIENNETKNKVGNTSLIDETNSSRISTSVSNKNMGPNVFNGFKQDLFVNAEVKVEDTQLLKNFDCDLKNVDVNFTNSEFFYDKSNGKFNHELSSLLNHYYNLNKNSCALTEQSENTSLVSNLELNNGITPKILQKEHIDEIERDVNNLLTDLCDVVNHVLDSNKRCSAIFNYHPSIYEPNFLGYDEEKNSNEIPNHSNLSKMLIGKNDDKDEKWNFAEVTENISGNLIQGNLTEPVENGNSKSAFDNCSDISQISNAIFETKSQKKRKRRKANALKNSTLVSKSSTNSSTSSPVIKSNSESVKNIKLINAGVSDGNKSLTNNGKTNTELKIPVSSKLSIGSVVNVIPNHSIPKKSVQCGSDSVYKNTNSTSIEDLTNRIKKLVTSFETVLSQNQQFQGPHGNLCNGNLNCICNPNISSALPNRGVSSDYHPNSQASHQYLNSDISIEDSAIKNSSRNNGISSQQIDSEVSQNDCGENVNMSNFCPTLLRQMHCCANKCARIQTCISQMHKCQCCTSSCALHSCHHCYEQSLMHCNHSLSTHGSQIQASLNVPNIVIPLQNISDDAIAQIISALRARS